MKVNNIFGQGKAKYQLNFMNFIGKPFQKPVIAYEYNVPDQLEYERFFPFVGSIQNLLLRSKSGYAVPYLADGKKVLCLFNIEKPWSTIPVDQKYFPGIGPLKLRGTTQINSVNESDRSRIELFLAQAIEQLLQEQNFFVLRLREAYRFVYQFTEEMSRGEFEIYRGFVFRPMVHGGGSASILIDPKYRLIPRQTLKDMLRAGEKLEALRRELSGKRVLDVCPIPPEECSIRRNPRKGCPLNLHGFGKSCYFVDFAGYSVKDAKFSILDYHKKCPFIEDSIDPEDPVVLIRFEGKDMLYEYPPSRIRVTKEYADLLSNRRFRAQLTYMIRPEPKRRYYLSMHFARYLRQFSMKDAEKTLKLELNMEFAPLGQRGYFWEKWTKFENPLLRFRDGEDEDALAGLLEYNALESVKSTDVKIALLLFGGPQYRDSALDFYSDLMFGHHPFKGVKKIFNLSIPPKDELDVFYSIEDLGKQDFDVVLVLDYLGTIHDPEQYYKVKKELQDLNYPSQFVKRRVLRTSLRKESRYINALMNIALGIYGKLGKIAWKLSKPLEPANYFLGIDIIPVPKRNEWVTSIHAFNNEGCWLGCSIKKSSKDFLEGLREALKQVEAKFIKKSGMTVVIHREGIPPKRNERQVITETLKDHIVDLLWVHKESYIRIYNLSRPDYKIERGVYSRLSDSKGVLFTYAAPVAPHGTPVPLMIECLHKQSDRKLVDLAREVFILSSINLGRIPPITLRPVTTHYANSTSNYYVNGVKPLEKILWFL
jgi:hypothetical protein